MDLVKEAIFLGFSGAAVMDTKELVFVPEYRTFCEENLCGCYNVNPACPPACGTAEDMKQNALKYENCPYAEDFKFWVEIAKSGGRFYIDSQPLLYYRISDSQVSSQKSSEQRATTESIINEVLEYLIELNKNEYPELVAAYGDLCKLYEKQLLTKCEVLTLFQTLFSKNEKKLNL